VQGKNYLFVIISFSIILPAFSGCWTYDSNHLECAACYPSYTRISAFPDTSSTSCHTYDTHYDTYNYYTFNVAPCELDSGPLPKCKQGVTPVNVYQETLASPEYCSSCDGDINCKACDDNLIGSDSPCDLAYACVEYDPPGWDNWACKTRDGYTCGRYITSIDCDTNNCAGCHWITKIKNVLTNPIPAFAQVADCYYNPTLCPLPYKISTDGTNTCHEPSCYNNAECENGFGPGFICENPGEWNAACEINASFPFGSTVYQTINNEQYKFSTRLDFNRNPWLDVYNSQGNLSYYGLRSNEQFLLGNSSYSSIYELPMLKDAGTYAFSLYSSSLVNRLTYSIFPVCGNGVCETCEDENNCLHYPPESCFSCSADCPSISLNDLSTYNSNRGLAPALSFASALTNPDNACKVRTLDSNSLCNPLCLSHVFIDSMGCIFNKYASALPEDDFNNKVGIYNKNITFNSNEYSVFVSLNNRSFYGVNNSLCSDGCECIEGNCDGVIGDKHCCQLNYNWKYTDPHNEYCYNGRIKPEYRGDFINYDSEGIITSTRKLSIGVDGRIESLGGNSANQFICLDNPSVQVGVSNKSSCLEGYDPYCVYGEPDSVYTVIKPDGVGQCREKSFVTPEVIPELKCIIHTHAWAHSSCEEPRDSWLDGSFGYGCVGDTFGSVPYNQWFCVTDNTFECSSYYSIREFKDGSEVVLNSITYYDFCHNPELVCGGNKKMTSNRVGGVLQFTNCPQDGYSHYDKDLIADVMVSTSTTVNSISMPVGYYCSLFGNDYDIILGVDSGNLYDHTGASTDGTYQYDINTMYTPLTAQEGFSSGYFYYSSYEREVELGDWGFTSADGKTQYIKSPHLPMINRDETEKLYHLLWNYESCKKIYPEIESCETAIGNGELTQSTIAKQAMTQDSAVASYPAFHFLGTYNYPSITSNNNYVVSKAFCNEFWQKFPNNDSFDFKNPVYPTEDMVVNGTKITASEIPSYVSMSCIYWHPGFLNKYYNASYPASQVGIIINPPIVQWGVLVTDTVSTGEGGSYSDTYYKPLNFDYWRSTGHCQANTLVITGQKCTSFYPKKLGHYDVNDDDQSRSDTCDCVSDPDTLRYPYGCV
jgi:hypothetical protein